LILITVTGAAYAVTGNISVEGRLDATGNISAANFFGGGMNLTDLGALKGITILTAASGNYTVPTGVTDIEVTLIGGGGGGAGGPAPTNNQSLAGGGGGGGACTIKRIATSASTVYSYVVGAGGAGAAGAVGTTGGQTQFNSAAITANGGQGGTDMATGITVLTAAGGAGGTADATGDISIPGYAGGAGYRMSGTLGISGTGGASLYGFVTDSVIIPGAAGGTNNGIAGALYGSGGGGAADQRNGGTGNAACTGGNGAAGVIIIREYK